MEAYNILVGGDGGFLFWLLSFTLEYCIEWLLHVRRGTVWLAVVEGESEGDEKQKDSQRTSSEARVKMKYT